MALIDHEERKVLKEVVVRIRDGLDAAEDHLPRAVLLIQARGIDPRLQTIALVLQVILLDQLFDVSEYEDSPLSNFGQFSDYQTLPCPRRQNDDRWGPLPPKVVKGAINRFLLVGPEFVHRPSKLFQTLSKV